MIFAPAFIIQDIYSMNKIRKVSFYYLAQEKHILIPEHNTTQITSVNASDIKTNFERIYNRNTSILTNGNRAISLETSSNKYVIEFTQLSHPKTGNNA